MLVNLTEFSLVLGDRDTCAVEDNESSTRRALINGAKETMLQVPGNIVLILQQRTIPIIYLLWSEVEAKFSLLPLLMVLMDVLFGSLEFLRGFGVSVDILKAQFKWVSHLLRCCGCVCIEKEVLREKVFGGRGRICVLGI